MSKLSKVKAEYFIEQLSSDTIRGPLSKKHDLEKLKNLIDEKLMTIEDDLIKKEAPDVT